MAKIAASVLKKRWNLIAACVLDVNVGPLNTSLWSREIYNDTVRDAIEAKATGREKMNEMLRALEKKVKLDATALDKFLEALRELKCHSLADVLESTRDELAKAPVRESSERTGENGGRGKAGSRKRSTTSRATSSSRKGVKVPRAEEESSSNSDENPQQMARSSDEEDDDNDFQEVAEQPPKHSRGTHQDGKKKVKLDSSEFEGCTHLQAAYTKKAPCCSKTTMDSLCSDLHLAQVAEKIVSWERCAPFLGLSEAEEEEIKRDHCGRYGLQKRAMLWEWKRRRGGQATYANLRKAFYQAGEQLIGDSIEGILAESSSPPFVLATFKQYLKDCYAARPHPSTSPHEWPQLSDAPFIDPKIILQTRKKDGRPEAIEVAIEDLFQRGSLKVLLEGVAGSGKTTTTWIACQSWAEGKKLSQFDYLIHLTLSDPELHSATTIEDIIPHPSSEIRKAVADAIIQLNGKGCCFILDGWEDLPLEVRNDPTSVLPCLLHGNRVRMSLPQSSFLVTSRPAASDTLTHSMSTTMTIEGFSDKAISLYAKKFLSAQQNENSSQQLLAALRAKPSTYSLCNLPINLIVMVFLFLAGNQALPATQTELFQSLVLTLLLRHLRVKEYSSLKELADFSSLPESTKGVFDTLCRLAHYVSLSHQTQSKVVISSKQLQDSGLPTPQDTLGLMKVNQQLTYRGYTSHYSFLHSSVQDFLCALWTAKQTVAKQNEDIGTILTTQPTSLLLPFLAGLTKFHGNSLLQMVLAVTKVPLDDVSVLRLLMNNPQPSFDGRRKLLALLHCIYESKIYKHFLKVRPPKPSSHILSPNCDISFSFHYFKLSCHDCTILGTFLSTVCCQLSCCLDLESSQIGDDELIHLFKPILEQKPAAAKKSVFQYQIGCRSKLVQETIVLDLSSNTMTHISVKEALRPVLSTLSVISGLDLGNNFKSSSTNTFRVMVHLIEALHQNNSCWYLDLAKCNLDSSRHIYHWILLLTMQSTLSRLNLSNTSLSPGFSLFCSALRQSTLRSIYLINTGLDDGDILILAKATKSHKSLQWISIEFNPFSPTAFGNFLQIVFDDMAETRLSQLLVEDKKRNQIPFDWMSLLMKYFLGHRSLLDKPTTIVSMMSVPIDHKALSDGRRAARVLPKTLLTGEK